MFSGVVKQFSGTKQSSRNYPDTRAEYCEERGNFPWRRLAFPSRCLIGMSLWVRVRLTAEQAAAGASYSKAGITPSNILAFVKRSYPEVVQEYEIHQGKALTGEVLMSRVYMWFLKENKNRKGCTRRISDEYPFQWASADQINREIEHLRTIS